MSERIQEGGLRVAETLHRLVIEDILPGTGLSQERFWEGLEQILTDLTPRNRELLTIREDLQSRIDAWHRENSGPDYDRDAYRSFLEEIDYLLPEPGDFCITTENVDEEVASIAGPQLVVPVMNARYALNAANARWGSLYDALYGTDVIPETDGAEQGTRYNPVRGERVIAYARAFLDRAAPLATGSHSDATAYRVDDGGLSVALADGVTTGLSRAAQLRGYLIETGAKP